VGDEITVEGSRCRWQISSFLADEMMSMGFTPQITAPLPLSAIYDILRGAEFGPPNPHFLDHYKRQGQERVIVTKEFFQSHPFDIDPDTVHGDLLGFLSIVLSWPKSAMNSRAVRSSKAILESCLGPTLLAFTIKLTNAFLGEGFSNLLKFSHATGTTTRVVSRVSCKLKIA
jgi:hypothetical protein